MSRTKSNKVAKSAAKSPALVESTSEPEVQIKSVALEAAPVVNTESTATESIVTEQLSSQLSTEDQCFSLIESIAKVQRLLTDAKRQMKDIVKTHKTELKKNKKHRRHNASGHKRETGFNKPGPVPDSLVSLLQLENGAELPRTKVTKLIYSYIKENNLYKQGQESDKRHMIPDSALRNVFGMSDGEEITFFTIQKLIKNVYNKELNKVTEVAPTVVETEPAVVEKIKSGKSKKAPTASA